MITNHSDELIPKFMFQRRPYITIADSLDCIRSNFLQTTGLDEYQVAPFDFTLVKYDDGNVSYRWILGYDQVKFDHILNNKSIFSDLAELVYSNIPKYPPSRLAEYYCNVLNNVENEDDIEVLTAVFHLTYRFRIPPAFNINLIHQQHLNLQNKYYRATLRTDLPSDIAGIPPLEIEGLPPQAQVSEEVYKNYYKPYEPFYNKWLFSIQGLNFYKDEYSYNQHLYFPIYDGILSNQRTLFGYIGMFFSDEAAREEAIAYFAPHCRYIFRNLDRSYKQGTLQNVVDSYYEGVRERAKKAREINSQLGVAGENKSNHEADTTLELINLLENPLEYWKMHLENLHYWERINLERVPDWFKFKTYEVRDGKCSLSIGKLLQRKEISSLIDDDFREANENLILTLTIPRGISDIASLTKDSSYIKNRVREIVQLLDQLLHSRHSILIEEQIRNSARRSAVSAVMLRNMSHNIGSHVLARLSSMTGFANHDGKSRLKYITAFNSFIRTRMDFLADLSTTSPALVAPLRVYRDTLGYFKPIFSDQEEFHWQELLLEYISGSNDLKARDIEIRVQRDGQEVSLEAIDQDPVFSSPNGIFGAHALYIILENIIRNSAKHAFNCQIHKKLILTVSIAGNDSSNDLMPVRIFDNLQNGGSSIRIKGVKISLLEYINEKINKSILDDRGVLRAEAWGLLEMKICAAYLRNFAAATVDDEYSPPLLQAEPVEGNLAYLFYLHVPREILIVDADRNLLSSASINERLKNQGIQVVDRKDFIKRIDYNIGYNFLILIKPDDSLIEIVNNQRHALPIRIFTTGRRCDNFQYIPIEKLQLELERPADGIHSLMLKIWKWWVDQEKYDSMALFIRPEDEQLVKKWNVGERSFAQTTPGAMQILPPNNRYIILDRHGEIQRNNHHELKEKIRTGEYVYYERISQKQPTYYVINHARSQHHLDSGIIYKLIESGAAKIIVLDERIQKVADETNESGIPLIQILRDMNILVPARAQIDLDNLAISATALKHWLIRNLKSIDFLVVHLGIAERMYGGNENKIIARIRKIEHDFPSLEIILVSGRGVPSTIRSLQNRFIQYSQVARYILEERSKYHLCKVLFAARRSLQ